MKNTEEIEIRACIEGLDVEVSALPIGVVAEDNELVADPFLSQKLKEIEGRLGSNKEKIVALNSEIDRLTNHADGIDYAVAVASGVICGLIDSFFVGEFDFANAKAWSNKTVNEKISEFAKKHGYSGDSKRLKDHVAFLEKKYEIPSDNLWSGKMAGISAKTHHLDDWAHHPTPVGWICSIVTQFTGKAFFANGSGRSFYWDVERQDLIGNSIPEKFAAGTFNWIGHLVSDMAGSNQTAGAGMGLPGPILSVARELSQLPGIRNTKLPKLINDVFTKEKFDLRSELAVAHELGRQAIPVIINEVLVRLFYFLRRLVQEWKAYGFAGIHWRTVLPFKNRSIVRMMTIATSTFTAIDLADAAIRAGVKTGGNPAAFWASFALHVNFVGVGRMVIAVATDVGMGVKRGRKRWERIVAMNERLHLLNAKVEIKHAEMWISAKSTGEELVRMYEEIETAGYEFERTWQSGEDLILQTRKLRNDLEKKNPSLCAELVGLLDDL